MTLQPTDGCALETVTGGPARLPCILAHPPAELSMSPCNYFPWRKSRSLRRNSRAACFIISLLNIPFVSQTTVSCCCLLLLRIYSFHRHSLFSPLISSPLQARRENGIISATLTFTEASPNSFSNYNFWSPPTNHPPISRIQVNILTKSHERPVSHHDANFDALAGNK